MSLTSSLNSQDANSPAVLLETLTAEKSRRLTENRLAYYKPYPKQAEFHNAGAKHRERLLMAGNQLGNRRGKAKDHCQLSAARAGGPHKGNSGFRFWPHLPRRGRRDC